MNCVMLRGKGEGREGEGKGEFYRKLIRDLSDISGLNFHPLPNVSRNFNPVHCSALYNDHLRGNCQQNNILIHVQ